MSAPVTAEELAEVIEGSDVEIAVRLARGLAATIARMAKIDADRDALAATVERLIREAGAIRNDERQRAEEEHKALEDAGRQRDANRIERLEGLT